MQVGLAYSLVLKIREHFLTVIRERCDDRTRIRLIYCEKDPSTVAGFENGGRGL